MTRLIVSSAIPLKYPVIEPERRSDERCEQGRERRDQQDVPRAREDSGEDVTTESVRTEEVLRRGGDADLRRLVEPRVVGRDVVAEDGAHDPEEDDRGADDEGRAPQQQSRPLAPGDARLGASVGSAAELIRTPRTGCAGSAARRATSATSVTTTYVNPMTSTPAESTV